MKVIVSARAMDNDIRIAFGRAPVEVPTFNFSSPKNPTREELAARDVWWKKVRELEAEKFEVDWPETGEAVIILVEKCGRFSVNRDGETINVEFQNDYD